MADWVRTEHPSRRIEYRVPCHGLWGAASTEVQKALTAAASEYRQAYQLSRDAPLSDDALRVFPGDDEVIIRFEVEESSRA